MNSSHTPGPWTAAISESGNNIITAGQTLIAESRKTQRKEYPASVSEHKANSRLIAAAPELLAALEAALPVLIEARESWSTGEDCYSSAESIVRAAISKATGRPA